MRLSTWKVGDSETPADAVVLSSKSMTRIPPLHRCWTRAHPHVPLPGRSHACCPRVGGGGATLLSFLKRLVTSSYSSALDHNFLLSPQKPYYLLSVLSSSFFHPSKVDTPLLKTQRKEGEHLQPFHLPLAQEKQLLPGQIQPAVAQTTACGPTAALSLLSCHQFQFSDLQIS